MSRLRWFTAAVVVGASGVAAVSALGATPLGAQPAAVAYAEELRELAEVPVMTAPLLDQQAIALEDQERVENGLPRRFAIPNAMTATPATHGVWEAVGDETLVWRLRVGSPGAYSLNLGFSVFQMPEEGRLLIYAADRSAALQPFTAEDNADHGELWTPVVLTDEVVIEVVLPASARDDLYLELTSVNVGYRGFTDPPELRSGSCN
ncbi:MAG: hypothetical protein GY842_21945, partial [bacterium]|nr:hypothetical protein [bacterium]